MIAGAVTTVECFSIQLGVSNNWGNSATKRQYAFSWKAHNEEHNPQPHKLTLKCFNLKWERCIFSVLLIHFLVLQ